MATKQSTRATARSQTRATSDEVIATQRQHPNSRPSRIAALAIGESMAEAKRVDLDDATKDTVNEIMTNLTSALSRAAVSASDRTGYTYRTQAGQFITASGEIMITAVVTRVA